MSLFIEIMHFILAYVNSHAPLDTKMTIFVIKGPLDNALRPISRLV